MPPELSSFEEIRRWIPGWVTQVQVRTDLKKEAEGLASLYRKK